MVSLSYSFHIGNDKNKTKKARQKNVPTNYNNNAIQNAMQLSKVNHHNLRQYDNNPERIKTLYGSNDIVNDVKELYKQEFDKARIEYNSKQTRDDRKIEDYYRKISNDNKHDLAVEIIIELGDIDYWLNKEDKEMYKMIKVYQEQVIYLKELVHDFKVANATIHFDESSPHLHVVGIAVKDNCKTGMSKQVGKCSVFTKDNLPKIQDKMRDKCIESFNKEYGLNAVLKDKQKGRNIDYRVSQMNNYDELVKSYNKQREKITKVKECTNYLSNKSDNVKNIINNLNNQPLSKNKYILSNSDKEIILDYIDNVNKLNDNFKKITNYTLSVSKIKENFVDNHSHIDELNKRVREQTKEIKYLKSEIEDKDSKISFLELLVNELKEKVYYLNNKFNKIINYLSDKVHHIFDKDNDMYKNITDNLFINDIIDNNDYNKIIKHKEKDKDDFYR